MAPHGGIFVFPVVGNPLQYLIALVAGTVVSALLLGVLKRKLKKYKNIKNKKLFVLSGKQKNKEKAKNKKK